MTGTLTIGTFPNEAAADYVRGKAVADPENFGRLPAQLKQRAFAAAGIERMDTLRRMKEAIARLPEGMSWDEAKRELAAEFSPYVGGDAKAARARAEFTLRTHGFQAYAVSRHQQQMAVAEDFPYWMYQTMGDKRVRSVHAALDGRVLRYDAPWWKTHYPPWDWGCRCIVVSLDEEDAREIGISGHNDMPTPERSGDYAFDPSDAGVDLDALMRGRDDADRRLLANAARNATVGRGDGTETTMWDYMVDLKMVKETARLAAATRRDGKERALVLDWDTGRALGGAAIGDARGVDVDIPEGRNVCTLHTHPAGDNTPSPADILSGFNAASRAEYIAAGKRLRRWAWLRTPTPEDAELIRMYDEDNRAGRINVDAYRLFLRKLVEGGYIKMEELS